MGFHDCRMCYPQGIGNKGGPSQDEIESMTFSPFSSQDVNMEFTNGHCYQFPHTGLLHYVTEHGLQPPAQFIADVMEGELRGGEVLQSKGLRFPPTKVGYLLDSNDPAYQKGVVPDNFVDHLLALIEQAENASGGSNNVTTTRGG